MSSISGKPEKMKMMTVPWGQLPTHHRNARQRPEPRTKMRPNVQKVSGLCLNVLTLTLNLYTVVGIPTVLTSSFVRDQTGFIEAVVRKAGPVVFKRTTCTIDPKSGAPYLSDSTTLELGQLNEDPLFLSAADRGWTKDVYAVSDYNHTTELDVYEKPSFIVEYRG